MRNLRFYIGLLISALSLVALFNLNIPVFMVLFLLSALAFGYKPATSFNACVTTCTVDNISTSDDCNIRGGLKTIYWAQYTDIDWEAMAADEYAFDPATQTILSYTMVGGAEFKKLTFDRKQGLYTFTYTEDTGVYEQVITTIFEGKAVEIRNAFAAAVGCCKLIVHLFDNNCLERVIGVEWDGATFEPQVKTLRITRHLDASGEFGSSKARDEMDFGGESITAPMFAEVGEDNMPYTAP